MPTVDSPADVVRSLFFTRQREHMVIYGGMRNPPPMAPVLITRDQFTALKMDWDPLKDGPPDDVLDPRDGVYHWRVDVPFIVDDRPSR